MSIFSGVLRITSTTTYGDDHVHFQSHKLVCYFSKLLGVSFGPTIFDSDGLPIEPSEFAQVPNESGSPVRASSTACLRLRRRR